ncbi:MAG TPA: hypothetical protein PK971_10040, partial [Saprospiraceae bacterium]|nr:hypothetical protein [Saprospiraceae bacterium]
MSEIEVKTFQNTTSKKGVIREPNKDFEVRSLNTMCVNQSVMVHPWWHNFQYMAVGIIFGLAFVKG